MEIISEQVFEFVSAYHFQNTIPLPYLMASFKAHKNTFRWITCSANCCFSDISLLLAYILKSCIEILKNRAHKLNQKALLCHNIVLQSWWVIDSLYDCVLNLPSHTNYIFSANIKKCYENIPHLGRNGLIESINHLIEYCFHNNHMEYISFKSFPKKCETRTWSTKSYKNNLSFKKSQVITLSTWLIDHMYIQCKGHTYRQSNGIPMGLACSPIWCNLYLHTLEFNYIKKMLDRPNDKHKLSMLRHAYRYFDDILWINNPLHNYFLYDELIYPAKLTIDHSSTIFSKERGEKVTFVNMELQIQEDNLQRRTKEKSSSIPIKVINYLHRGSNRPSNWSHKVILSQIKPILYCNSNTLYAVQDIKRLVHAFCINGFERVRLWRIIKSYLANCKENNILCSPKLILRLICNGGH